MQYNVKSGPKKNTLRNCFNDQPLRGNIVVFVVCCCLFPSLFGFNPTLTRRPPVLSEERHRGWMPRWRSLVELSRIPSQTYVVLEFLVWCCHCAAPLISSSQNPETSEAPPTLETSPQHVALFINYGVAKRRAGKRRQVCHLRGPSEMKQVLRDEGPPPSPFCPAEFTATALVRGHFKSQTVPWTITQRILKFLPSFLITVRRFKVWLWWTHCVQIMALPNHRFEAHYQHC